MKIKAISISDKKGMRKKNIDSTLLIENFGLNQDAHGGKWHRQVSFLAQESIDSMRDKGLDVVAGNFAENITTLGIDLVALGVGAHLQIGPTEIVISQLGKICHNRCAIFHQAGDCVMPREGIFGVIIKGGNIHVGDDIKILSQKSKSAAIIATDEDEKESGEEIRSKLLVNSKPAFIRFDSLSVKTSNIDAILKDLTETQNVDDIIVYDPSGTHELVFLGYEKFGIQANAFRRRDSIIYYCKNMDDVSMAG